VLVGCGRAGVLVTVLVAAALVLGGDPRGAPAAAAPTAAAPTVTSEDPGVRLRGVVALEARAAAGPGRTIASVSFEYARALPSAQQVWTPVGTSDSPSTGTYTAAFLTMLLADGYYDVRALATDSAGETAVAVLPDRVVANGEGELGQADLEDPGAAIRGTVAVGLILTPAFPDAFAFKDVVIERSPAGLREWSPLGTPQEVSRSPVRYEAAFATDGVPDGLYDLRARATDGVTRKTLFAPPVLARRVDNTAPTVALAPPGSPVAGRVILKATAADAGSGVASVRFERAPSGTDAWVPMASDQAEPFVRSVDTRAIVNGIYDLRAVARDAAGNVTASDPLTGVQVENPPSSPPRFPSLRNVMAPAQNLTLLGGVTADRGETWAVATTPAAPAEVGGVRLPYTALGGQPVLLRYRDGEGWQIVDVPRNPDGTAFRFLGPDELDGTTSLTGAMSSSGEAWLWITQTPSGGNGPSTFGLFHRRPGGPFVLDEAATETLGRRLLGQARGSLRLRESRDGRLVGILISPEQEDRAVSAPAAQGGTRAILARLDFGLLEDGAWSLRAALPPADLEIPQGAGGLTLRAAEVDDGGTAWGLLSWPGNLRKPLLLGRLTGDTWAIAPTGLDVLDLPAGVGGGAASASISPALGIGPGAVWIGTDVDLGGGAQGQVVARYDTSERRVTRSWCAGAVLAASGECGDVADGDLGVPSAVFTTPGGEVALAMAADAVLRYADDEWTRLPTPGYFRGALFTGPEEGWLSGEHAVGHWAVDPPERPLVEWPQANRAPLTAVAAPGGDVGLGTSGALAVGLRGTTMRYEAGTGWLFGPLPGRAARANLYGVAFSGPSSAVAVGQGGTIVRWDGASWSEDPQSRSVTPHDLSAVAFRPSGEGWAVGRYGTILHFDGAQWSEERPPADDEGRHVTSVAVAGSEVFAVAGGNLISRGADGRWERVDLALLPEPRPAAGDLRLVSALPDGGVAVGGIGLLLVRDRPGAPFRHSAQPIPGVAVALAATRGSGGEVRPIVSVAPPVAAESGDDARGRDVGGVPAGDGELLRESASGGWEDLSQAQHPRNGVPADGVVKLDPVLAAAADVRGERLWAVGGYAGTPSASGQGSDAILAARSSGWDTSSIWRFDADGRVAPPGLRAEAAVVTERPGTVSFAFFSAPECRDRCSETLDAQPDVNLTAAARQIAAFAEQPGGPAFAILGGNARGPNPALGMLAAYREGRGATEFRRLPALLAPLGRVPLFAAFGSRDAVPTLANPAEAWADAFASAPAPFGRSAPPPGITPAGAGLPVGNVHRYYAFDATQGTGTIRVVVLDNSAGSLEGTSPGQTQWMQERVSEARARGLPVIVVAYRSLAEGSDGAASDGSSVADYLAGAGVSAVLVAGEGGNVQTPVPVAPAPGAPQVVQFQGARLSYQSTGSYVAWYRVSVDTATSQVAIDAVPPVESLAVKPLAGLTVARSQTLEFQAIARRPRGSLAVTRELAGSAFENLLGFDSFVPIPAPSCPAGTQCISPLYRFSSSDPTIGDFVEPSGPGSRFPRVSSSGRTAPSSTSGLFCAYNGGTTTVSVTVGLLTASLPVTVRPGGFGPPCGTVGRATTARPPRPPAPRVPRLPGAPAVAPALAPQVRITVPRPRPATPAPPAPLPRRAAAPPAPTPAPPADRRDPFVTPKEAAKSPAPIVPPVLPAIPTPTPPGGASVFGQSPASAPRREKAHKHASQSAYRIRPAGVRAAQWFAPAVAAAGVLALLLAGAVMRPPRNRPAPASLRAGRSRALVPPCRPRRR
jgi:hypothetical protein